MKKSVFIDRDGVINKDPGGWTEHSYVTRWEDFLFLPRVFDGMKLLHDSGFSIIIISNQGGISKGFYNMERLKEINENMSRAFEEKGVRIKKAYYCPHQTSDNCECRKPKGGLFRMAEKELGVRAEGAFFIGDNKTDVEAGFRMGMRTILVLSGKTARGDVASWDEKPEQIFDDLFEAAQFIVKGV